MHKNTLATLIAAFALLTGCDSAVESGGRVQVQFRLSDGTSTLGKTVAGPLEIVGSNGTLRLSGVHLVVAEFELDRADEVDCDLPEAEHENDGCEEFEAPPFFVDLPLDDRQVTVASSDIAPGTYKELDFEIEDLGDDDLPSAVSEALLAEIRNDFPSWPDRASVVFVGEFETSGGDVRPFTVFAHAEIEIEMHLDPPITIDSASEDQGVTVVVDPAEWLKAADGTVIDLSASDYETTGHVLEFDVEFEHGFKEIEFES